MEDISIIYFPNWTCSYLAKDISYQFYLNNKINIPMESIENPITNSPTILLIFPIHGDERIPPNTVNWLNQLITEKIIFPIICGDFPRKPEKNDSIFWKINQILDNHNIFLPEPIYISTPVNNFTNTSKKIYKYINEVLLYNKKEVLNLAYAKLDRVNQIASSNPSWIWRNKSLHTDSVKLGNNTSIIQKIANILNYEVIVGFNQHKECVALSLTTSDPYPRSLMPIDSDTRLELFKLIYKLEYLEELSIPFCGDIEIPILPSTILRLDLRGSPLLNWDILYGLPKLKSLNLAACNLLDIPESIRSSKSLKTLHLYKNHLSHLPEWLSELNNLEYLMLYRNKLTEIPEVLSHCRSIKGLNIGANNINEIPNKMIQLENIEVLGLRLLPLKKFPIILQNFNSLKKVDLSGTAYEYLVKSFIPKVQVTINLPKWW